MRSGPRDIRSWCGDIKFKPIPAVSKPKQRQLRLGAMLPSQRLKKAMAEMDETLENRQIVSYQRDGIESFTTRDGETGPQQTPQHDVSDESLISDDEAECELEAIRNVIKREPRPQRRKRPRSAVHKTDASPQGDGAGNHTRTKRARTKARNSREASSNPNTEEEQEQEQEQEESPQIEPIEIVTWGRGIHLIKNSVRVVKSRCVYATKRGNMHGKFISWAQCVSDESRAETSRAFTPEKAPWAIYATHPEEKLLDNKYRPLADVKGASSLELSSKDEETQKKPCAEANALAPLFCGIATGRDVIECAASPFFDYELLVAQVDPEVLVLNANATIPIFLILGVTGKTPLLMPQFSSTNVINGIVDTLYAIAIASASANSALDDKLATALASLDCLPQAINPTSAVLPRARFSQLNAICSPADRRTELNRKIKKPYDDAMKGVPQGSLQPAVALTHAMVPEPELLFNDTEKPEVAFELVRAGMPHTQVTRMTKYADRVTSTYLKNKFTTIVGHLGWGAVTGNSAKKHMPILIGAQVHLKPDWFPRYYNWLLWHNGQVAKRFNDVNKVFQLYRTFLASDLYMRTKHNLTHRESVGLALIPKSYFMRYMVHPVTIDRLARQARAIGGPATNSDSTPFMSSRVVKKLTEETYRPWEFREVAATAQRAVATYAKAMAVVRCPRKVSIRIPSEESEGEEGQHAGYKYEQRDYPIVYELGHFNTCRHFGSFLYDTVMRWRDAFEDRKLKGAAQQTPPIIVKGLYVYSGPQLQNDLDVNVIKPLESHCANVDMLMVVIRDTMSHSDLHSRMRATIQNADLILFVNVHRWRKTFAATVADTLNAKNKRKESLLKNKFAVFTGLSHVAGSPIGESMLHEFSECTDVISNEMGGLEPEFKEIFDESAMEGADERPTFAKLSSATVHFGSGGRARALFPDHHRTEQLIKNENDGVLHYASDVPFVDSEKGGYYPNATVAQKRDAVFRVLQKISEHSPDGTVIVMHRGGTKEARQVADWVSQCGFRNHCIKAVKFVRYSDVEHSVLLNSANGATAKKPRLIIMLDVGTISYKLANAAIEGTRERVLALENKQLFRSIYFKSNLEEDVSTLSIQTDSIIVKRLQRLLARYVSDLSK